MYYVESDINGRQYDSYYPASPSNVELAYTAIGEPGTPPPEATLSGPSNLESGGQGSTSYV